MRYYNIHFSPTGGTRKVADIICGALEGEFNEIDLCCNIVQMSLCEEDICLVSVPSYGGRVPVTAIERLKKISGNGAKAVLNCVYGNRAWEDTLTELQDTLEGLGFREDSAKTSPVRLYLKEATGPIRCSAVLR